MRRGAKEDSPGRTKGKDEESQFSSRAECRSNPITPTPVLQSLETMFGEDFQMSCV